MHAVIETDKGPIEIEFFASDAPKAVENFRLLAEHGYYDGLTFHRIVKGFMIQGGDPVGGRHGRRERVGRHVCRRDQRQIAALQQRLPAGHRRDGQCGAEHQRQPVLHPSSGLSAAAALRDLRESDDRAWTSWTRSRTRQPRWGGWRNEPAADAAGHQEGDDPSVRAAPRRWTCFALLQMTAIAVALA